MVEHNSLLRWEDVIKNVRSNVISAIFTSFIWLLIGALYDVQSKHIYDEV